MELELDSYMEGDVSSDILPHVIHDSAQLLGKWELIRDISESSDALMSELGIPYMKRALMKNCSPTTKITDLGLVNGHPTIKLVTILPMNIKKEATIISDGSGFDISDSDTGVWETHAQWHEGRLMQRRVNRSSKGVMYDTRAVVRKDPSGRYTGSSPLMLFKWTYKSPKSGKTVSCNRWMKKVVE